MAGNLFKKYKYILLYTTFWKEFGPYISDITAFCNVL